MTQTGDDRIFARFGQTLLLPLALSALLVPAAALAQDVKVEVTAEVVLASTKGNVVDPPSLAAMKAKLDKFKYTSFKRISHERLQVTKGAVAIKLPNGAQARLKLDALKEGVAQLSVSIPPAIKEVVYTLGREGSLFIGAGKHGDGDLWLVLSPIEGAKGRRAHPASPVTR